MAKKSKLDREDLRKLHARHGGGAGFQMKDPCSSPQGPKGPNNLIVEGSQPSPFSDLDM